ncbi:MAG TPA: hypothetical protein VFG71_06860 [Nitrospiraceae bacterium]|nr:hypothetical protein [Nitrospiraceae bacterium]
MSAPAHPPRTPDHRSPSRTLPLRFPGLSVEEPISFDQSRLDDLLAVALCLVILAVFEWCSWFVSLPVNRSLFTIVALIAIGYTWWRLRITLR